MNEKKLRRLVIEMLGALDEVDSAGSSTEGADGSNGIDVEIPVRPTLGPVPAGDARQANVRGHALDAGGKVTGVHLTVHELALTRFRCTNVFLRDEESAQGQTIAQVLVYDRYGNLLPAPVILGTGYGGGIDFDDYLESGNGRIPTEHPIQAKFSPPNLGPLAIFVAKPGTKNEIDSDVVASLGLPYGHHVSYVIEFRER